jgi:hypothetical protein
MSEYVTVLDEPALEFASGQTAIDPHDGLALFGAYSADASIHSPSHNYIVLGSDFGLDMWDTWAEAINRSAAKDDQKKHRLWPPYPGFEVAFGRPWAENPERRYRIDRESLLDASRKRDPYERCYAVVEHFLEHFPSAKTLDAIPGVAVCVIPDEVWMNCRPESHIVNPSDEKIPATLKKSRKAGQFDFFDEFDPGQYQLAPDFRRQLKARTMKYDIPVQIARESTLRLSDEKKFGERGLTPLSDRMWNLTTTLYYKCGGKPWKLNAARKGVCYVGLSFRLAPDKDNTACCAAQMFLDSGDGIVFLGDYGPWYSPEEKQCHLSKDAARTLLSGVLDTYKNAKTPGDPSITEIFLHCRSLINDEEFSGYQEACPAGCKIVGIRVRPDRFGPRLFRGGRMPILRGTFWQVSESAGYLFGAGFKPRIATYDGWEIPVPLRIDLQHGEADIRMVARDIFALTKLNYNTCRLGDSQPVTVGFSNAVGEILISNPTVTDRRHNFKYYI